MGRPYRRVSVRWVLLCLLLVGGSKAHADEAQVSDAAPVVASPRDGEVALPAGAGWHASLVLDNGGVGVWTVASLPVFPHLACPEVVGLDDRGRCHVLTSYSGRWTPLTVLEDGRWLGGLAHGDVDPRAPGAELYVGSERGHLYQIRSYRETIVEGRRIALLPGREIHTIVAGDLDPRRPGSELLVFTRPGGLYRVSPTGTDGEFEVTLLMELPGRVRDALVLPAPPGEPPAIATVSRAGRLELLRFTPSGPAWETVYEAPMGLGRIALRPVPGGGPLVLYTTHDDGRILRHARAAEGRWNHSVIYHGPQGPRGIAAGRFDADATAETVAVFGYGRRVELLTCTDTTWRAETLFTDTDKGHWLAAAEVDGRNATDELLSAGYSGRIVLLARPPGYGRSELAAER